MASGPITSQQIEVEKVEAVTDFVFLGSKSTVDVDCSHEIKRYLLLGRKAMTNLDSILKIRYISLPTKVHIIKALVFLVVTYGCENWTIKKGEHQRTDAFGGLWTARWSNQSILKEINPEYSLEGWCWSWSSNTLATWLGRAESLKKTLMLGKIKGKSGWQRMKGLDSITDSVRQHHRLNGHKFEQTPGDNGGQRSLVCCSPLGHKELDMT